MYTISNNSIRSFVKNMFAHEINLDNVDRIKAVDYLKLLTLIKTQNQEILVKK